MEEICEPCCHMMGKAAPTAAANQDEGEDEEEDIAAGGGGGGGIVFFEVGNLGRLGGGGACPQEESLWAAWGGTLRLRGGGRERVKKPKPTVSRGMLPPELDEAFEAPARVVGRKLSATAKMKPPPPSRGRGSDEQEGYEDGGEGGDGAGGAGAGWRVEARRRRARERRRRQREAREKDREEERIETLIRSVVPGCAVKAHFKAKGGGPSNATKVCQVTKIAGEGIVKVLLPSGLKQKIPLEWVESVFQPKPPSLGVPGEGAGHGRGNGEDGVAVGGGQGDDAGKSENARVRGAREDKQGAREDRLREAAVRQKAKRRERRKARRERSVRERDEAKKDDAAAIKVMLEEARKRR